MKETGRDSHNTEQMVSRDSCTAELPESLDLEKAKCLQTGIKSRTGRERNDVALDNHVMLRIHAWLLFGLPEALSSECFFHFNIVYMVK